MRRLHDKAAEAYNGKLHHLPNELVAPPPRPSNPNAPPPGKGDAHIVQRFGPGDIDLESYREYLTDYSGARVACFFHTSKGLLGLTGDKHKTLVEVANRIANDRAYRDSISEEFAYLKAVNWLKNRAEKPDATPVDFTAYVEDETAKAVKKYEVWLPLPVVQITQPFEIGWVTFRRITKEMMDDWASRSNASSSPKSEAFFDRQRSRLQSATAACVQVEAEPIRGSELANIRAEASISILRLACPAMVNAFKWAPIDPTFIDRMGASIMLRVEDRKIVGQQNSLHPNMLDQWLLSREDIAHHMRTLWGFGHNLLVIDRNEFQETLLAAILQYSKSVLKSDMAERLLYIVSALESLFIKDARESIVQNLRERMAALGGANKDDRLKLLETVTRVYELRSGFVHRGLPVADVAQLEQFFLDAWTTFFFVLNNYNKWLTRSAFLRTLDDHKFSGPEFSTAGMPAV